MQYQLNGQQLIRILNEADILISADPECGCLDFKHLSFFSKEEQTAGLFICKGSRFRDEYLSDAGNHGAIAYMAQRKMNSELPGIIVSDIPKAMGLAAAAFYEYPQKDFTLIGVTGTKGKSTTAFYIVNVLEEALNQRPAYINSIENFDGKKYIEAHLTTPETLDTFDIFSKAKENGIHNVVMECSSQAIIMQRLVGIRYNYGVYTNISNDHIAPNEHPDFENYLACKMAIVGLYDNAIINLDDAHAGDALKAAAGAQSIMTFSLRSDSGADVYAKNIQRDGTSTHFTVVTPKWEQDMTVTILGEFNVSNALAACCIAVKLDLDPQKVADGIERTAVSGRMMRFEKDGKIVIVDYAHNKASISEACKAVKTYYPKKKLVLVFGCAGNKALQRRYEIPEVAVPYCDHLVVTADDPAFEDPADIAKQIAKNILDLGGSCEIITDRTECVNTVVGRMTTDEVILIAGKGEERCQKVKGQFEDYAGDDVLAKQQLGL